MGGDGAVPAPPHAAIAHPRRLALDGVVRRSALAVGGRCGINTSGVAFGHRPATAVRAQGRYLRDTPSAAPGYSQ